MLTSIASIIVVTRIYENRIQEKISDISLLKEYTITYLVIISNNGLKNLVQARMLIPILSNSITIQVIKIKLKRISLC